MLKLILALAVFTSAFTLSIHNFDPFCFCPQGFQQQEDELICAKNCPQGYSKITGQQKCFRKCPHIDGVSQKDTSCVFQKFIRKTFEGSNASSALRKCVKQIGKAQCELSNGQILSKCPPGYTITATQCEPEKIDCSSYGLTPTPIQTECTRKAKILETSPIMCA